MTQKNILPKNGDVSKGDDLDTIGIPIRKQKIPRSWFVLLLGGTLENERLGTWKSPDWLKRKIIWTKPSRLWVKNVNFQGCICKKTKRNEFCWNLGIKVGPLKLSVEKKNWVIPSNPSNSQKKHHTKPGSSMLPIDHSLMVPRTNAGNTTRKTFRQEAQKLGKFESFRCGRKAWPRAKWFGLVALGQFKGQWWLIIPS